MAKPRSAVSSARIFATICIGLFLSVAVGAARALSAEGGLGRELAPVLNAIGLPA
ncbi:hypothetical protein [Caulobacter mirabilis]|uniref:hypothetical protein n=1 Tax=Caulobacter mirabilis TaxID=69666 RepID=UPI0015593A49|nr:hypothetical protein [Caulobacter mirabilis]